MIWVLLSNAVPWPVYDHNLAAKCVLVFTELFGVCFSEADFDGGCEVEGSDEEEGLNELQRRMKREFHMAMNTNKGCAIMERNRRLRHHALVNKQDFKCRIYELPK